jgi:tetratricopeptide (TPR) repeat protein
MRLQSLAFTLGLVVPAVASANAVLPKGQMEINRASDLIVRGDYAGAEPLLRKALIDAPDDPYGHFNLGSVLRATGRYDEAVIEFHKALDVFESQGPRANGAGDIASSLYNIALAQEAKGDPRVAVGAWDNYIRFASKYKSESPSVEIAKNRIDGQMRLAQMKGPFPFGPQKAAVPRTTR